MKEENSKGLEFIKKLAGFSSAAWISAAISFISTPIVTRIFLPEEIGKGIKGVGHRSACGIKYLKPNKVLFSRLNDEFNNLERNSNYKKKIIEVDNLSFFVSRNGKVIGEENMYMLSQNKTYVRYTGTNIQKKKGYTSAQEYIVDGISVMCFDSNVNFDNGLILPMQERGNLRLYLEEG